MIALVLGAAIAATPWPVRLDALEVTGLDWTQRSVVERELPWREGEVVSEEAWELGTTRLWNTDLFSQVSARVEERPGGAHAAVYELEERFSLNPLISYGVGGGRWWFRVGANDINFLGRFLEWGARYERFDAYNGGQAWMRNPRLFDRRLSGLVQVDSLFRPRPEYVRRRLGGTLELGGEVHDRLRLGGRAELFHDDYGEPLQGPTRVPASLTAAQGTGMQRLGRVDTLRLRQKGWSLEFRETIGVASSGPAATYGQVFSELLAYAVAGERWNLALRAQAAASTPAPTELQFYLGGLDLVRGYPDSSVRTQAYALANAEVRATVFDSTWFAIVGVGFLDGAVAQQGAGITGMASAGLGLRLLVPKLVRTGLRADGVITLTGMPALGASLGVFQFF